MGAFPPPPSYSYSNCILRGGQLLSRPFPQVRARTRGGHLAAPAPRGVTSQLARTSSASPCSSRLDEHASSSSITANARNATCPSCASRQRRPDSSASLARCRMRSGSIATWVLPCPSPRPASPSVDTDAPRDDTRRHTLRPATPQGRPNSARSYQVVSSVEKSGPGVGTAAESPRDALTGATQVVSPARELTEPWPISDAPRAAPTHSAAATSIRTVREVGTERSPCDQLMRVCVGARAPERRRWPQ